MVSKFRIARLHCRIQLREVAAVANISAQRLNQLETGSCCSKPRNTERLIDALETVMNQRKKEMEKAEFICKNERESLFDYMEGSENL